MKSKPHSSPPTLNALLIWSRQNRLTCISLLCVVAAFLAYTLYGRTLVREMYDGTSWAFLNRIIKQQSCFDLNHYQRKIEIMLFGYGTILVLATAFFSSLWSGRRMKTGGFVLLLGLLSLSNIAFVLPVHDFGALITHDDFPKFYSTGVENGQALLRFGSPFGYNHNFQGGIPAFYLKSSFLGLLPFMSIFGEQAGHQVMLIVFLLLIPISLYFLVRETVRIEIIAQCTAFMAAFQIRSFDYLGYGMTPAILSISLFFLALLFLLKYVYSGYGRLWLFASLAAVTGLVYTHLIYFALVWVVFAVILAWAVMTGTARFSLTGLLYLGGLTLLAGLPFFVSLMDHLTFFHTAPGYAKRAGPSSRLFDAIDYNLQIITRAGGIGRMLLLSTVFLFFTHVQTSDDRLKRLIKLMFFISAVILVSPALQSLPHMPTLARRALVFAPFAFVLNAALCLAMNLKRQARAAAALVIFFLVLCMVPFHPRTLETVGAFSAVDPALQRMVAKGDHVLFENTAHVSPTIKRRYRSFVPGPYGHWLTYLQRHLGIRFFSNVGEDPHTYNKLRHMYITNGTYLGKPLGEENGAALLKRLEEWGVNKVCVWSKPAIEFFESSERFSFLALSTKYHCFRAEYEQLGEVRLSGAGRGKITEETPFSMTIALENITRPQTVTVARNQFKYWTATNEAGEEIPLKEGGQMISFEIEKDGAVHFRYRKHTILYLVAILALLLPLVFHPWRTNREGLPRTAG